MPAPAHDKLIDAARKTLVSRLRDATGSTRHAWAASPDGRMDVNATFALVQAWLTIDPAKARELVESVLDAQEASGRIPRTISPDGSATDDVPAWPLLAQSAAEVFRATGDEEFAARVIKPLARHTAWLLRHFAGGNVYAWTTRDEALIPTTYAERRTTADLHAILIAEIQSIQELAAVSESDEPLLKELAGRRDQLIDQLESHFWSDATRIFQDRGADGVALESIAVTAFLPLLWSGLSAEHRKALLGRLCRSRDFGLAGGIPVIGRTNKSNAAESRPAMLQVLVLEALLRSEAYRERAVLAASIRRRLAAMYEISGTLSDDLADADPARGEMSNVAAALVLLASSPARTEETDDMQRHALRVADRRLVLAALSGVAILLLWGIAAGARSLHREQARAAMQLAQMAYASGDHESVVAILKPVDSGRDAGAEFILGKALFKLGRIEEAERAFRAVEAMDPRLGSAWYNHALCLYEQGRMVEAIRAYENVQEQFATAQPDLVERASMAVTAIKGRIATH